MRQVPRDPGLTARMFFTMFLLAALYLLFIGVLYQAGVGFTGLVLIAGGMLLLQYFFADRLVLLSTGAKVLRPEEAPELHAIVYRLAVQAGIPKPRVALVPTPVPNAFATGRSPGHAVVAVTQGLLDRLNQQEVEAVLAHELSHVRNWDMAVMTMASFFATVASFLMRYFFFFSGGIFGNDREDRGNSAVLVYIASLLVWAISYLLIMAISRYREFAADRGSAYLTGAPANLRSALVKISGSQLTRAQGLGQGQGQAISAFLIIPSAQSAGETIAELFSTHPSLKHRLAYLEELEREINH
ncbi:MAG: zinc metalloprotease HtpX [Thermacetogeniaceae bacterium]